MGNLIQTTGFTAYPRNPAFGVGKKFRTVSARAALTAAAATAGDIVQLTGPLSFGDRIARVLTPNASPALTSATDAKLGFMTKNAAGTMVVINTGSDAVLWNGVDLHLALSARDLLTNLNSALDTTKNIGQLLALGADSEPSTGVFLCLTMPTATTADGVLNLDVIIDEATTN